MSHTDDFNELFKRGRRIDIATTLADAIHKQASAPPPAVGLESYVWAVYIDSLLSQGWNIVAITPNAPVATDVEYPLLVLFQRKPL